MVPIPAGLDGETAGAVTDVDVTIESPSKKRPV